MDNPALPEQERLRTLADRLREPPLAVQGLLEELLARAVTAVGAAGGSLLVPAPDGKTLRFFVSYGPGADKLKDLPVPIEGSIAGYVFSTDQMMAVGDLEAERPPQFYAEISKQIGIATRTYLAVPILLAGRARGVATYVNRPGSPPYQPFQQREMEKAYTFAVIEAVLLRHLDYTRRLADLAWNDLTAALDATPDELSDLSGLRRPAHAWARALQEMESLEEEDQDLGAELIALLGRRRQRRHGG